MTDPYTKPLPTLDPDSAPYWEGIHHAELRLQRCHHCGTYRWPARVMCNRCFSFEADWSTVSGKGTLASWVQTCRAFLPVFEDDVPYINVTVRLAEQDDILIIGIMSDGTIVPYMNMPVRAVFKRVSDAASLLFWAPEITP
jgi:uncharacterized protein